MLIKVGRQTGRVEKRKGGINEGLITEINQINIFFLFFPQFPRVGKKKHLSLKFLRIPNNNKLSFIFGYLMSLG